LLAIGCAIAYFERTYVQLADNLARDVAAARAFRWERPVLRGAMGDGNASDDIYAALADWVPIGSELRRDLAQRVYFGQPLEAAQVSALAAREPLLHALRAAAQQRWSHTDLVAERGLDLLVPEYPKLIEAALGLLAEAQTRAPEPCLQEAADVIRIGQDLVPSAPLEATSVAARLTALSARVIARCALHAELLQLRKTTHELRVLATHAPPTGSGIELEELASAHGWQERAALTGKTPAEVARTLWRRPQLLAAWSRYENPARFRSLVPEHYPDALEEWRREQDFRLRESPETARLGAKVHEHLLEDMRGQATLRMLCVAVSALAERAYRGSLPNPPSALRDAALADPFRGQPLRFRLSPNGAEFTLWSVAADFRDDDGSDDSTDNGPRDITLHVALR
jgi:hypothetical protein